MSKDTLPIATTSTNTSIIHSPNKHLDTGIKKDNTTFESSQQLINSNTELGGKQTGLDVNQNMTLDNLLSEIKAKIQAKNAQQDAEEMIKIRTELQHNRSNHYELESEPDRNHLLKQKLLGDHLRNTDSIKNRRDTIDENKDKGDIAKETTKKNRINHSPKANAGPDIVVKDATNVTLSSMKSSDSDGDKCSSNGNKFHQSNQSLYYLTISLLNSRL